MNYDELIELAVTAGYCLLENGAETYRVEESISRILKAYGVMSAEAFAVPSCIIVTMRTKGENGETDAYTRMKRITERGTNLGRISRINDLCRRICRETPDCRRALGELEGIRKSKVYCFPVRVAASALIAFAFTLFFGGDLFDALWAIPCGAILQLATRGMSRFNTNWFFANIMGSAIVTALAFGGVQLGLGGHFDKIIIGTLMNLVPGVALTNSMRDIIAGDLLSGITKLIEALMIAAAIALGSGIALYALRMLV